MRSVPADGVALDVVSICPECSETLVNTTTVSSVTDADVDLLLDDYD